MRPNGSEISETIPLPENAAKVAEASGRYQPASGGDLGWGKNGSWNTGVTPGEREAFMAEPQVKTTSGIKRWVDVPSISALPADIKVDWAVDGIIPRYAVTLIAGESGHFKSWLAFLMGGRVASGGRYLGRACQKMPVVYFDRENPAAVVRERAEILGLSGLADLKYWGGWLEEQAPGLGDFRLLEFAREHKPLMIFDSLIRFHEGEENSASEMARVMGDLRQLANAGATPVPLHHRSKSETSIYRGSSDIKAGIDVGYAVTFDQDAGLVTLKCFKNRYAKEATMVLRPDLDDGGDFVVTQAPEIVAVHDQTSELRSIIEQTPGLSQMVIVGKTSIPRQRATMLLRGGEGKLWRVDRGTNNAKLYYPIGSSVEVEI